ncbi:hypothetical protein EG68_07974 [Paragonimus skrjabini miyazakii]|uniref:Glycine cleavage system H protein n=1 Tax=Paragonimus skrjabini miyazakii TaxID=59628 RepID=A0A8S9YVG2_9TREM|nr:hypothetical protein EG68_07974 [Paragonimus skrjabini miyazakii]
MLSARVLRLCFSRCSGGVRLISTTVRQQSDFYFTAKHEWIKVDECAKLGTVGISEYAEQKLGDIVFVELPEKDDKVTFDGWLFKMKLSNMSELAKLMTPEKYKVYLETDA